MQPCLKHEAPSSCYDGLQWCRAFLHSFASPIMAEQPDARVWLVADMQKRGHSSMRPLLVINIVRDLPHGPHLHR